MALSVVGQGPAGLLHMLRPHLVVQSRLLVNVSVKYRVGAEGHLCVQEIVSKFSAHGWWSLLDLSSSSCLRTQLAPGCL